MNLHLLKTYFVYTKSQRLGILSLLSLIFILQLLYFFIDFTPKESDTAEKEKWLSLQTKFDSLKNVQKEYKPKAYPFNPNFITDFKGYRLGMSVVQIDRLLAFRKENKYVNSAAEFQRVTGISDSLLAAISPYFKFPDWTKNAAGSFNDNHFKYRESMHKKIVIVDINSATQEDLMKVHGIGPALSERILKQRELLGAFINMDQLSDIWGLSPEVIEKLGKSFNVSKIINIKRLNINTASLKELSDFPYFRYRLAKAILTYRSMNGGIHNFDDLTKINDFPVEKIKIIALYLEL
jgi:DNA uptake protein ComE-like DNA-binding protein